MVKREFDSKELREGLKEKLIILVEFLLHLFLAAMSSSRSDVVTQCVFPCFRVSVPFFSFNVLEVSASPKVFQWCFNGVSRPFKVCLKFKGSFKDVSNKSFKGVYRKF